MIIAELGINHNGDLSLARTLINAAAAAGADIAKFQNYHCELLAPPGDKREMLRQYQISEVQTLYLKGCCDKVGIEFCSTPFDKQAVDFLTPLVKRFKIGSGQSKDVDFVSYVASKGKPIILSTGMSDFDDIRHSLSRVKLEVPLTILHCVSQYPTLPENANLVRMQKMMLNFECEVGYSDHTTGIDIALAAKALGAKVIEKHFTLDTKMEGPDHSSSITYPELKALVDGCRRIDLAFSA